MQRINHIAKQQMQNQKEEQIKNLTEQNQKLTLQNQKLEKQYLELQKKLEKIEAEYLIIRKNILDPNQILLAAAKEGNLEKAKAALDLFGADLNTTDLDGTNPLFLSLLNGHTDLASLFLKNGASLIVIDKNNQTILDLLCSKKDFETAHFVLENIPKDDAEAKALFSAYESAKNKEAKELIANTLLFQAAKQGNKDLAEKALQLGANINVQENKFLETALHKAVYSRQLDMVKFLLEKGSSCKIKDKNGQTPIEVTSDKKTQEIILNFVNKQATKIQALARGFFARNSYRQEVQNLSGEVVSKLYSDGKYDDVNRLTNALQENRLVDALKIIHEVSEKENNTPRLIK